MEKSRFALTTECMARLWCFQVVLTRIKSTTESRCPPNNQAAFMVTVCATEPDWEPWASLAFNLASFQRLKTKYGWTSRYPIFCFTAAWQSNNKPRCQSQHPKAAKGHKSDIKEKVNITEDPNRVGGRSGVGDVVQPTHNKWAFCFTLDTVRSVISCSKARVSSACFWLCSAIFSLNFLGFEPPVPGELDMVLGRVWTILDEGCRGGRNDKETVQLELSFTQRRPS